MKTEKYITENGSSKRPIIPHDNPLKPQGRIYKDTLWSLKLGKKLIVEDYLLKTVKVKGKLSKLEININFNQN